MAVHHEEFSERTAPLLDPIWPPSFEQIHAQHRSEALKNIGLFKLAERRLAKDEALAAATQAHRQAIEEARVATSKFQADADAWWNRLLGNDPEIVLPLLEEAFEDNEVPAAAVGIDREEVALVVLVPDIEVVPERSPSVTAAGNISLTKMAKRERVAIYNEFVAGCLLVSLKEAWAVAPGVQSARVAVLRDDGPDSYGRSHLICLLAGRWSRQAFDGVIWTTDATRILTDTSTELLFSRKGQAKELQPLDLTLEPDIQGLIEATDFS